MHFERHTQKRSANYNYYGCTSFFLSIILLNPFISCYLWGLDLICGRTFETDIFFYYVLQTLLRVIDHVNQEVLKIVMIFCSFGWWLWLISAIWKQCCSWLIFKDNNLFAIDVCDMFFCLHVHIFFSWVVLSNMWN